MNIVILAAGQGKRMHSSVPKVLHEIAGKSLLGHVLNTANALRPQKLCVVYGHGGETVKAAFTNDANDTSAQSLAWALQAPQLGTGHAVQQALPHLKADGTTLILYGDVPLIGVESLQKLVHAGRNALGILTIKLDNPSGYGRIVRNAAGQVQRIVEHKDASPAELAIDEINTGIMAMPSAQLVKWLKNLSNNNAQQEYYLTDIVHMAAQENFPIATASPQHAWEVEGVNSQLQLARLERVFQAQQADKLLENGVHLLDPARFDVRGELICGRDVSIDVNCVFEGRVVLADGVRIASHCVIKNAQIGAGTQIAAFSHIEDARVGAQAKIGPFARLRPGASLAENVHIGNFVEIKKSTIAAYSKVNHLAYIGDALIGERVNVGAGTITCNYDGVNKFQTIIEDDVFIGSDTQLVAPVKVGRGATLGAGTTLTKDAPPGALTVARARQITLSNWKRPLKVTKKV